MKKEEAIKEIKSWTDALLNMGDKCTQDTTDAQTIAVQSIETLSKLEEYLEPLRNFNTHNEYVEDIKKIVS